MNKEEAKFILSNTGCFNKLKSEEIDELLSFSKIEEYRNGDIIYRQNDPPDYFYFILKGKVVAITYQDSKEIEIDLLGRGTSFGIISLFTGEPHSVTTKSIEESVILKVDKEKFKEFLNKHPQILLDFSRMLSQRVKAYVHPKRIFQFKRIAILGFSSSGKTTYMYELSKTLKDISNKKIICIELSLTDNFTLPYLLGINNYASLKCFEFDETNFKNCIIKNEVDYLLLEIRENFSISGILNFLSENYHFILYEIPSYILEKNLENFIIDSDYIHFVSFSQVEELEKVSVFLENLKIKNPILKDRIKIILNEFGAKDTLSYLEKFNILKNSIYATLPDNKEEHYTKALRRISREISQRVFGVALGSGAAYGFAHIGVLEVLEENKIPIDIICGSSMGAFIASLWALGYRGKELIKLSKDFARFITKKYFLGISLPFLKGVIKAKHLEYACKKIFKDKKFYDIKNTLKIIAFDFSKKDISVLDSGFIYKAVAASCAIPGIFEPVDIKDDMFLDGGILNPLPTKVLLNYGANKIIAVNITPTKEEIYEEYKRRKKLNVFDFIFGSIETMQRQFISQALDIADIVIHPNFEGLGWMEFDKIDEFIERGRSAAKKELKILEKIFYEK